MSSTDTSANLQKFMDRKIGDELEPVTNSAVGEVRKSAVQAVATKTSIHQRKPQVVFDVNDVTHRQLYADFMVNRHWGVGAPRFLVEQPYATVPAMCADRMLAYYMALDSALVVGK